MDAIATAAALITLVILPESPPASTMCDAAVEEKIVVVEHRGNGEYFEVDEPTDEAEYCYQVKLIEAQ